MGAKISCYTCEHYRPTGNPEVGLCMILDDSVYSVSPSSNECLYNFNLLPKILTKAQATARDKKAETRRASPIAHVEALAKEVSSWPEEKRKRCYGQ